MGTIFYLLTPPGVTVCLDVGGPTGRCSDFDGTIAEIATYEEEKNTYPERVAKYEEEKEKYEKEKSKYEAEKTNDKTKGEIDTEEAPEEPVEPTPPGPAPSSYADYRDSFCSYHSAISPTNPENGDGNTILYAVIPWVAGGDGDYHVALADETQGFDCQDGGFNPTRNRTTELEEKEHTKIRTPRNRKNSKKRQRRKKGNRSSEGTRSRKTPRGGAQPARSTTRPDGSYDTGLADIIINQIAVEQQNTVTDPLLNAWQDSAGNEVTDECRNCFVFTAGCAGASLRHSRGRCPTNRWAGNTTSTTPSTWPR